MQNTHAPQDRDWIGGIVPLLGLPGARTFAEEAHAIIWMGNDRIQGIGLKMPEEGFGDVVEHLFETFCSPLAWRGPSPSRLRVSDPALARALRADRLIAERLDVIVAPTPELDPIASTCRAVTARTPEASLHDLLRGWVPWAREALAHATASLFRSSWWSITEATGTLAFVACERVGVDRAALCLLAPPARGFVLVEGFPYDPGRLLEDDPPLIVLSFTPWEDPGPAARSMLEFYGSIAATEAARPVLCSIDADGQRRELDAHEQVLTEATARALVAHFDEPDSPTGRAELSEREAEAITLRTHVGGIEVRVQTVDATTALARQLSDVEDRWGLMRGTLLRPRVVVLRS